VFGDPSDPADPGAVFPGGIWAVVDAIRAQAGIPRAASGFAKGLEQAAAYAAARQSRPATAAEQAYDAARARDTAETMRERAERMHRPVRIEQIEETWNGSLPVFRAGQL
jgi:hypothetical protein